MLVVAVTVGHAGVRVGRRIPDLAAAAGSGVRFALSAVVLLRGLVGLLLVSYGAWLAYEPAGFIVFGLGVLADRLADERRTRERRPE